MDIKCEYVSYESTGLFTPMTIDYVNVNKKLTPFYKYPVSLEGIKKAIQERKIFPADRNILVNVLKQQYSGIDLTIRQQKNIESLLNENTFTITTAHQPVIFTGPLYFIYKIFHAIRLADDLNVQLPDYKFVPVFYMGSEDADLDELGHIHLNGRKISWNTKQTGAVGRMQVDDALLQIIDAIAGEIGVEPFGNELINLFRQSYQKGTTIQQATLTLVNLLFRDYGLLVVIPDNEVLKAPFNSIVKKELSTQFSHTIVAETISELSVHYKQQAAGRDINLFYLNENSRERIEKAGERFIVKSLKKEWTQEEILSEADQHPERFSSNVILRPLFQETILPNIVFIGGGGETSYWLELKKLFEGAGISYPMLVLRNSFLFINKKQIESLQKLGFETMNLFKGKQNLMNELVTRETTQQLSLTRKIEQISLVYKSLQSIVSKIDNTLEKHATALEHRAVEKIIGLEKKMLRAEKRKFEAQQRQIEKLLQQLFPNGGLQERVENFSIIYARYGKEWMQKVYECSNGLQQAFAIVEMKN